MPLENYGSAIQGRETDGDAPEEEEEGEEEEEEPRLKYQRLGSSVTDILRQDAASCLCVSDKLLALGTHDGTIHVLDFAGNEASHCPACPPTVTPSLAQEAVYREWGAMLIRPHVNWRQLGLSRLSNAD